MSILEDMDYADENWDLSDIFKVENYYEDESLDYLSLHVEEIE
jgi:hypothetical protein